MKLRKPTLAARALTQLVNNWPAYSHGEFMSGNLSLAGFKVLSDGNFASVVEGNPHEVIKLFNLNDIGYQVLLSTTINSSNTHLPKIFSFTKSGNYGIVELERLVHKDREAISISKYIDAVKHNPKKASIRWGSDFKNTILSIDQIIRNNNSNLPAVDLRWDTMENNIMFRDNVPVLSDVIFGEKD